MYRKIGFKVYKYFGWKIKIMKFVWRSLRMAYKINLISPFLYIDLTHNRPNVLLKNIVTIYLFKNIRKDEKRNEI